MKRLHTGVIVFDTIDIICISFSVGSCLAYLMRKHKESRDVDPIVTELKEKSPVIAVSIDGKPLKLPLVRGGDTLKGVKGVSLAIKSKRLAALISAIVYAKRSQKLVKLLQIYFAILNASLTSSVGLRFAVGGSLDYTQFILIAFPATAGGFLIGQVIANPLASVFLPLAILYGRGIEDIPDPYEKCKLLCKVAEEFHNKQLAIDEMKNLNSLVEDTSTALQLPLDKVPLVCVEEKLSLLQRFKLRKLIESERVQKRVQHFNEFIKQFPECDADPETVYEQVVEKIPE
jgi:hypothetical protein